MISTSRRVGMAEVANGVLHNVGNVLNSVNVSSGQLANTLRQSAAGDVGLVAELLKKNSANLGDYLTRDVKGQQIPSYLGQPQRHSNRNAAPVSRSWILSPETLITSNRSSRCSKASRGPAA